VSWKFRLYGLVSAVILGILTFGQIPTHSTTDTARVVKYAQNDIVPAKGRPTDASEMAKRWFKSQPDWVPSDKAAARFGSRSHSLLGAPRKWGKKKEKIQLCLTSTL
jgi:hypothetical protein